MAEKCLVTASIRLPEALWDEVKQRAADADRSPSDYVRRELARDPDNPYGWPDHVITDLKKAAAAQHLSLADFLLRHLRIWLYGYMRSPETSISEAGERRNVIRAGQSGTQMNTDEKARAIAELRHKLEKELPPETVEEMLRPILDPMGLRP